MKRHIGTEEDRKRVKSLLRKEKDAWRKDRLIALNLGFDPNNSRKRIADILGVNPTTVQRWFTTYRSSGIEGLLKRNYTGRTHTYADEEILGYLREGLEAGRWNTLTIALEALNKKFNKSFEYHNIWYWVKKCNGVIRIPRPVHEKRNHTKAEKFKRSFLSILKHLPIPKNKEVKIWFADESRYGLLPILRGCWTRKGLRQYKKYATRYEWSYCYGGIDPINGDTVFVQTPSVNLNWTEVFLNELKKKYPNHEHVVLWDGAGFHPKESTHENVPENVHVVRLPPYSPELNPIEKLWDLIQDHTSNKLWPSIKRLDEVVANLLEDWWTQPQRIISLFGNNWHRASANAS